MPRRFDIQYLFSGDPADVKRKNPEYFAKTCTALDKGTKSVEKAMLQAIAESVSLLQAAAAKEAAEKEAEQATVEGIMKHLVVPKGFTSNYDNGCTEYDVTSEQLPYYHGLVKERDSSYSLSLKNSTGLDICFHNVKITSKGCRWFFAEKITINDKVVAADFSREEFGLYGDLLSIKFDC